VLVLGQNLAAISKIINSNILQASRNSGQVCFMNHTKTQVKYREQFFFETNKIFKATLPEKSFSLFI